MKPGCGVKENTIDLENILNMELNEESHGLGMGIGIKAIISTLKEHKLNDNIQEGTSSIKEYLDSEEEKWRLKMLIDGNKEEKALADEFSLL